MMSPITGTFISVNTGGSGTSSKITGAPRVDIATMNPKKATYP